MELILVFILWFSSILNINGNYILIPIESMIYNPKNDPEILTDIFSLKFSEDIYFNLTIGNPKQIIPIFIRLDKYELKIKEPNYISSLSTSFKYDNLISDKIISKENVFFTTFNNIEELKFFIYSDKEKKNKIWKFIIIIILK